MYLRPGERFDEVDRCDLSGMDLIRVGGDTIVESIDEGGAADKAGLAKGDVILDVGGTAAASLSMIDLSRIFCTPSTRSLIVRRPGSKVHLTIELEEKPNGAAAGGAADGDAEPAQSGPKPRVDVQRNFRIAKHGNPILLPVDIGSERHTFLFDTGTAITSFDVSLKPLLLGRSGSRSVRSQFDLEGTDTELFVAPPMSLGGEKLRGISEVTCVDQAALRAKLGEDFDGVLGMDAIYFLTVQIDFDGGQLSVLPSAPKDEREWMKLALCTGHLRAVDVGWVGEDPGIFIIDTGYVSLGSGSLNSRRFRSLLEARQAGLITSRPTAKAVRPTRSREAKVASFTVGESEHKDLVFQEGPLNALSLNYLSRYLVTICFWRGRMCLKPGARFNCSDVRDLSGMKLAKHDGEVIVESLDRDCAGEQAGLLSGDVIVEIDGIAVKTLTMLDLRRMLGEPSTRSLIIRRGATRQQAKLELRDRTVD